MSVPQTSPELTNAGPAELLEQARGLIQTERFEEAEGLLEALVAGELEHGDAIEALYLLAVARRSFGRMDEALAALEALLEEEPDFARAYQERGHAFLTLGQADRAAAAYNRAVELNPALTASWRTLAKLHTRAKRVNEAQVANKQLAFLDRLPPELVEATSLIHEGRLTEAESTCRRFLQDHDGHVEAMRLLAAVAVRHKDYEEAERLLERCVAQAPEYTLAAIDYLNCLVKRQRFEDARQLAARLIEKQPHHPVIQAALATTYVGLGRYAEAIALYRRVLEKQPANHEVHVLLGHALRAAGEPDAAVDAYRAACAMKSDFGEAYRCIAESEGCQLTDEELACVRKLEAAAGISLEDRVHLCFAAGTALQKRGQRDAATKYHERGKRLSREQRG